VNPAHGQTLVPLGLLPWQKIFLGYLLGIWTLKYPWAGLCGLFLLLLFIPFKLMRLNLLVAGVFLLSFLLAWFRLPEPPEHIPLPILEQKRVLLQGQVQSVGYLPGDRQRIIIKNLIIEPDRESEALPGKLVWTWQQAPLNIVPGQNIQAHLTVRPVQGMANFGVWNSEFFWRTQGVFWRSYSRDKNFWFDLEHVEQKSLALRQSLKQRLLNGLDIQGFCADRQDKIKGLGLALFFGDRSLLDSELLDTVRLASLAHTLALSGLHLGIMAGMGFMLAGTLGHFIPGIYLRLPFIKLGILLAAPICLVYIWMGQYQPTLIRAGIMLFCWGWYIFADQRRVLLDGLFMAAALITLYNPWAVFDLRLQLSVMAVAGIALAWPLVERILRYLDARKAPSPLKYFLGLLGVTLAANIALLPVQAWTFNYISAHLYLNLIWIPVLGIMVLPAGFAGLFISLVPGAGYAGEILLGLCAYLLGYFIVFMEFLRSKELLHPIITYRPAWSHIFAYYIVLILMLYNRFTPWKKKAFLAGLAVLVVLILLPWAGTALKQEVKLNILDVGQGQSVLLELPDKKRILIDGGGSWNPEFDLGRQVVVPALTWRSWPNELDMIILSHAHVDHYGGLIYPIKYLGAKRYLHNGIWPEGPDRQRFDAALKRRKVETDILNSGEILDLGNGLKLEVLHPEKANEYELLNDSSLVLRLVWHGRGLALIPGDIEALGINDLLESEHQLEAQVLIVPHHGSRTSANEKFYQKVNPEIAVVARGFMNRFRVPHPEVLKIMEDQNIHLYDTAVHGQTVISWSTPDCEPEIRWARSRTGRLRIPYWY